MCYRARISTLCLSSAGSEKQHRQLTICSGSLATCALGATWFGLTLSSSAGSTRDMAVTCQRVTRGPKKGGREPDG